MRIYILTQNAPVYLGHFLDDFLEKISSKHSVEGIVISSPISNNNIFKEIIKRFNFYGFINFIKMTIFIVSNKIKSYLYFFYSYKKCVSVSNVIKKYNIPEHQENNLNSTRFINHLKKKKIDLIISIASPVIFKKILLNTPKLGCINYHTGYLPKYRGRQPLFWAMLNNEDYFGISIHFMDTKIDNGPIIIQIKVPINSNDSLHNLYQKSIEVGPHLLSKALNKIVSKDNSTIPNNLELKTQYSFPRYKDAKKFRSLNKNIF